MFKTEKQNDVVAKIRWVFFVVVAFSRDLVTSLTKTSSVSISPGEINAT